MNTIANSEILRKVLQNFSNSFSKENPNGPKLLVKVRGGELSEGYSSSYYQGVLTVEGNDPRSLIHGIATLNVAVKSGHLSDFLGDRKPRYELRPLHYCRELEGVCEEKLCQRILELGYNAIILETEPENPQLFKEFGIKTIFKRKALEGTPFDKDWALSPVNMEAVDAVYWEATFMEPEFLKHKDARDFLQMDLALFELQRLERELNGVCEILYALPKMHSYNAVLEFIDEVSTQTTIVFSAVHGDPTEDHSDPHPLWDLLRESPDASATTLLPILNMGAVKQGEGLWPLIPLDLLEQSNDHMRRQPFTGAIVLVKDLPNPGTFLDGSLWIAAQTLWGTLTPSLLLETWCKAYHPSLSNLELLRDLRKVGKRISALKEIVEMKTEESHIYSESLISEINRLQMKVDGLKSEGKGSIKEYFIYFARDARRQILHFLQVNHAPMVNVLNGDDLLESFWTAVQQGGGADLRAGAKVKLFDQPIEGDEGSVMRQIYDEVRRTCLQEMAISVQ